MSDKIEHIDIQIQHCINWIGKYCRKTNTINRKRSSYGLKHDVERWAGTYISNEAFKSAAAICGLKSTPSAKNEYYNIYIKKNRK